MSAVNLVRFLLDGKRVIRFGNRLFSIILFGIILFFRCRNLSVFCANVIVVGSVDVKGFFLFVRPRRGCRFWVSGQKKMLRPLTCMLEEVTAFETCEVIWSGTIMIKDD